MDAAKVEQLKKDAELQCAQASLRANHLRQQAAALVAQAEQAEREAYASEGASAACDALLKADEGE